MHKIRLSQTLADTDLTDPNSLERYAIQLEGMTFRDVLDLDIHPASGKEKDYSNPNYKGGMGNLLEERFFGYNANSDSDADFAEAGIELKATCYDLTKKNAIRAGERLVLTMIPYDRDITEDFNSSHLWEKCQSILLVYYQRDKSIDKIDQTIKHVTMFTPPEEDLQIIKDDYRTIVSLIQQGRADELSEGMTSYLGACTKGATAKKSIVPQHYSHIDPSTGKIEHRPAKKRAFALKQSYMNYVLNNYVVPVSQKRNSVESLIHGNLGNRGLKAYLEETISPYVGMKEEDICVKLNIPYRPENKSHRRVVVQRILNINSDKTSEFQKANIKLKTICFEQGGGLKENISLPGFKFKELVEEDWEDSSLRDQLENCKFFFVAFRKTDSSDVLIGCKLWNMNVRDIEQDGKACWEATKKTIREGVQFTLDISKHGNTIVHNNLPGSSDNKVLHVRPHTSTSAYKLASGYSRGDIAKYGDELPDGQIMTKQSFWFNNTYIAEQLKDLLA